MSQFARETSVSAENSRGDIERELLRYGAAKFAYFTEATKAAIAFEASGRRVRFIVPMPNREDYRYFKRRSDSTSMSKRSDGEIERIYQQLIRQRWRALLLVVKAKLEAVDTGITTFEDEFLPYTVLPNGKTVSEWIQPQITGAYETQKMPKALWSRDDRDALP